MSFSAYYSLKFCLPYYTGDNEMLYSEKFHPLLWETQPCCMDPMITLFTTLAFIIATNTRYIFCLAAQLANLVPTFFCNHFFKKLLLLMPLKIL